MIAESKDFKTITLRGLEDKKNLVEIMNQVMKQEGLKTGQAVIEFIIADYAKKAARLEEVTRKREAEKKQYYQWQATNEEESEILKGKLKTIKTAFQLLNEVDI
ncbi:hypothetical protein [Runella rosea]|nr:hypothetical protein [Runella rosea]